MNESILTSIKKLLGIAEEYTNFDADIIMNINSVFMTLQQLGIGPTEGFMIEDDTTEWSEYIDVEEHQEQLNLLSAVKTYIYLKVKLVFDPPLSAAVKELMNQSIAELEWRMNIEIESK